MIRIAWAAAAALFMAAVGAHAATTLAPMRALHITGNFGGNVFGFRAPVFGTVPALSVQSAAVEAHRGTFVDSAGVSHTNDSVVIHLDGVRVGSASYAKAGAIVAVSSSSGEMFLQFRPSLDPTLNNIPGFSGDVTLTLSADRKSMFTGDLTNATGPALDYIKGFVAHGADVVAKAAYTTDGVAQLGLAEVARIVADTYKAANAPDDEFFSFLAAENAEWLGVSVAIFNGPLDDPAVRIKYKPAVPATTDFQIYTFDDADLQDFITRARQRGYRIYLTLAFEPSNLDFPPNTVSATCKTAHYIVNRNYLGRPAAPNDVNSACVNPAFWWWNPSHPDFAKNTALFWSSYRDVAVKYARMAQQLGVEMYSLGTETEWLFRSRPSPGAPRDFGNELRDMVSAVRAEYNGLLTYDQLYNVETHPEFFGGGLGNKFLFSDLGLDVVGVSAYFPLATQAPTRVLSVSELESAWDGVFHDDLVPLQQANPGKPIVFLEFGYTDDVASPFNPASNEARAITGVQPTPGGTQQQNAIQAFFNVNERNNRLVRGAFLWGNDYFPDSRPAHCNAVGFGVYCKPAAATVSAVYGRWAAEQAAAQNHTGLWWNALESGWGINFDHQGDIVFATLFTYDAGGKPLWLVMSNGARQSGETYTGTLFRTTGPPFNAQPFTPITAANVRSVGNMTVTFSGNGASLSYAVDGATVTKALQKQVFTARAADCVSTAGDRSGLVNYQDLWWNPAESGWGLNIAQQGSTLFASLFTYDASGQTMWLVMSAGARQADGSFVGDLYRTTGPAFNAQPFTPIGTENVTRVGTMRVAFTNGTTGMLSYSVDGANVTKAITRQVFSSPLPACSG